LLRPGWNWELEMRVMNEMKTLREVSAETHYKAERFFGRWCQGEDSGQSAVEFALVLPVMLLIVTGITAFGLAMSSYMQLIEATAVGARQIAISRGQVTDPCAAGAAAIAAAAPMLNNSGTSSGITYSFTVYTTPTASTTYTSSTPSCVSATLTAGQAVTVATTYPCVLHIFSAFHLVPPTCAFAAKTTEVVQ